MNEFLLLLLIVFTLMTFWSLNKKMGNISGNTPLPAPVSQPEFIKEAKVLYSSMEKEYNRLWMVTSVTGDLAGGLTNTKREMTVIYHQLCHDQNMFQYRPGNNEKELIRDVCVISSISDLQYRHVLLPADFKI
ncbi:MAG: hypothetical protein KF862_06865 [Chitinophagaceae bacterium]|nr:hypothetical protein [Chitinophagaceae bacterium]